MWPPCQPMLSWAMLGQLGSVWAGNSSRRKRSEGHRGMVSCVLELDSLSGREEKEGPLSNQGRAIFQSNWSSVLWTHFLLHISGLQRVSVCCKQDLRARDLHAWDRLALHCSKYWCLVLGWWGLSKSEHAHVGSRCRGQCDQQMLHAFPRTQSLCCVEFCAASLQILEPPGPLLQAGSW